MSGLLDRLTIYKDLKQRDSMSSNSMQDRGQISTQWNCCIASLLHQTVPLLLLGSSRRRWRR